MNERPGFADPTRLSIIESLRKGKKSVSEIVRDTEQSQSNVSNHLGCLLGCNLVKNKRDGRSIIYSLRDNKVSSLLEDTDLLLAEIFHEISCCNKYSA
jgi:DNA-binding transcriptional ArsR family regulator